MNMKKKQFLFLFVGLLFVVNLQSQNMFLPERLFNFGPIPLQKPILLDSVNLNNTTFTDEMMLSYLVTFPEHTRFKIELTPDSSGFFHLNKPQKGQAFQLLSFL